jgi:hypothetical protein
MADVTPTDAPETTQDTSAGSPPTDMAPAAPSMTTTTGGPPAAPVKVSAGLLDDAGLINKDGTFVNDWHLSESLPEDIRGSESLKVIKNLTDLAKRTVHAEKMVGKNKIAVPKQGAPESEWAAFHAAVGAANPALAIPSTPEEYKFDPPIGMEEIYTEERIKGSQAMAHKIGATKSQYEAFMQADAEQTAAAIAVQNQAIERKHDEDTLALKKEWGEAYPERQHVVKRLISEAFGNNETAKMNFLQKFAGDPDFVRFAANVGSKMVESKALVAELTQQTPNEAVGKIKQLRATPGYLSLDNSMTSEQRLEITQQIEEQYRIAYPTKK